MGAVLVIGSGGREHALCWRLAKSPQVNEIYCAPGNPGIAEVAECASIRIDDLPKLVEFAQSKQIDLTIVGPELPLSIGIVDAFQRAGLKIFGPTKAASSLESSKSFAKKVMLEAGVKTAAFEEFTDPERAKQYLLKHGAPIVVKVDGLAAGKGVAVCLTATEATNAIDRAFNEFKTDRVVLEEFLTGREASFIVATDGKRIVPLATSHDYKRIFDRDQGPNTGGMGTVSPTPRLTTAQEQQVMQEIIEPVVARMAERRTPFSGFLYAGLMISESGEINVIEFNARLGDPETQVIMSRMEYDFAELMLSLASEDRELPLQRWSSDAAVCVVIAAPGYPGTVEPGSAITGVENGAPAVVFHAGTAIAPTGELVASGGRVLNVVGRGVDVVAARKQAYSAVEKIELKGMQYRKDIGQL